MLKLLRLIFMTAIVWGALHTDTVWRVWQLQLTRRCPNCNLTGVDLSGLDLRQTNLKKADLRWATLKAVNLDGANLRGANLRYARLEGVTTKDTDFCGAVMMNAVKGYCRTPNPADLSQTEQTR
jgi:uncharacterized protein YjbI with pentapeptide repeats